MKRWMTVTSLVMMNKITQELINNALLNNEGVLNVVSEAIGSTPSDVKKFLESANPKNSSSIIFNIDGGSRGNPGTAGCGVVVDSGSLKEGFYYYLDSATNNAAEYTALDKALDIAIERNAGSVLVYTDSELVTKQINGEYKVKNENLKLIFDRVKNKIGKIKDFEIKHVRREYNREADKLANMAMDKMKSGKTELTVAL